MAEVRDIVVVVFARSRTAWTYACHCEVVNHHRRGTILEKKSLVYLPANSLLNRQKGRIFRKYWSSSYRHWITPEYCNDLGNHSLLLIQTFSLTVTIERDTNAKRRAQSCMNG